MSKKLQQVLGRIQRELSGNPLWQQTVGNKWICPYCGNLVRVPKKAALDKRVQLVAGHLTNECPSWDGFKGGTLALKVLKGKRLALLIDFKLQSDPVWQCFDEAGHWHCPFSLQRVTMPSRDPQQIRDAIKEHLKHNHSFNHGRGKTHSADKMQQVVDRANMVDMLLPRVRDMLTGDARWQEKALDGSWVCPLCTDRVKSIDISTEILRRETAPRKVAEHLVMTCKTFAKVQVRGKDGNIRPPEDLVRITNYIDKRRERKARETAAKEGRSREITVADLPPVPEGAVTDPDPGSSSAGPSKERDRTKSGTSRRGFAIDKGSKYLDESAAANASYAGDLSADGFSLSVNVTDDEKTTWDVIDDPDASRVNSGGGEGITSANAPVHTITGGSFGGPGIGEPEGSIRDAPTPERPIPAVDPDAELGSGSGARTGSAPGSGGAGSDSGSGSGSGQPAAIAAAPVGEGVSTSSGAPAAPASGDAADIESERMRIVQQALSRARRSLMEMVGPIPRASGYEFGAVFRPSAGLDGDFFQYIDLGGGRFAMACWEISEKGMDMVPINRHFLDNLKRLTASVAQAGGGPREILSELNVEMHSTTPQEVFVSVLMAVLDTGAHTIDICNAGYQPLLVFNQFRKPALDEINTNGIVLGSDEGSLFSTVLEQRTFELRPQDLLIAHSQGVAGWDDVDAQPVDLERFKGLVGEHGRQDASYFLSMADAEYKRWRGGGPTPRDLAILAIKRL